MIDQMIERAKAEIAALVAVGTVPNTITAFGDLHEYLDANGLGGCFDLFRRFDNEKAVSIANEVQCALDAWIAGGGVRSMRSFLQGAPDEA
jgi:hypothetical protein